jgi:hypothetical protein
MLRLVVQFTPVVALWVFLWFLENTDHETRRGILAAITFQ